MDSPSFDIQVVIKKKLYNWRQYNVGDRQIMENKQETNNYIRLLSHFI